MRWNGDYGLGKDDGVKKIGSVAALEDFGRVRLSKSFYMRDFLYSDISSFYGIPNIPEDADLAVSAGRKLCEELLEPLAATFGGISIRSAYRSCGVNAYGNEHKLNCASNENNYAAHIWDRRDADGCMGTTACIVVRWFSDRFVSGAADWRGLAWWIDNHPPYSRLCFFPKLGQPRPSVARTSAAASIFGVYGLVRTWAPCLASPFP